MAVDKEKYDVYQTLFDDALQKLIACYSKDKPTYKSNINIAELVNSKNLGDFVKEINSLNQNIIIQHIEKVVLNKILYVDLNRGDFCVDLLNNLKTQIQDNIDIFVREVNKSIDEFVENLFFNTFTVSDLNYLSLMSYESVPSHGKFCVISNKEEIDLLIPFDSQKPNLEFNESALKQIRKLLEICRDDFVLILQKNIEKQFYSILGFASKKELETKQIPIIKIKGKMHWEILYEDEILHFIKGKYQIKPEGKVEKVIDDLIEHFPCIEKAKAQMCSIINELITSKCGTIWVFVSDKKPVEELCSYERGISLKKENNMKLTTDDIHKYLIPLCRIDGALVFDEHGQLFATGTILDGKTKQIGDSSRGSRYNSTLTFVQYYHNVEHIDRISAIVVSEDGYVDLILPQKNEEFYYG